MPWILGGAILGSALIGGAASSSAAGSQANAAQNATDTQLQMFNQIMGNLSPYQQAGGGALGSLEYQLGIGGAPSGPGSTNPRSRGSPAGPYGGVTGTPGGYGWLTHPFGTSDLTANLAPNYNFQLGQGLGQIANAGAATGMSGNTSAGLESFAQNYAANAYQQAFENYTTNQQNIYGRLGNLAQLGEQASTGSASGAPLFASGISQTIQGLGAANAAGTIGTANAITGGLSNLGGYYALNNMTGGSIFGGGGSSVPWDFSNLPVNTIGQPGQG